MLKNSKNAGIYQVSDKNKFPSSLRNKKYEHINNSRLYCASINFTYKFCRFNDTFNDKLFIKCYYIIMLYIMLYISLIIHLFAEYIVR